jgi:DNA-binding CsgD family transcriptional regulator
MPAILSIQVSSETKSECHKIEFYHSDQSSQDAEKLLLGKIQELLSVLRTMEQTSVSISIEVETNNITEAIFQINKKLNREIIISDQKLSLREVQILGFIMQGYTNIEIAEKLFISYETVKSHRKHILNKTGSKNTASLINYYHQTFFEK